MEGIVFFLAIQTYKSLHNGSTAVPRSFVVPKSPLWPTETWGCRLGSKVAVVRAGRIHKTKSCREKLDEIGFIWDPNYDN